LLLSCRQEENALNTSWHSWFDRHSFEIGVLSTDPCCYGKDWDGDDDDDDDYHLYENHFETDSNLLDGLNPFIQIYNHCLTDKMPNHLKMKVPLTNSNYDNILSMNRSHMSNISFPPIQTLVTSNESSGKRKIIWKKSTNTSTSTSTNSDKKTVNRRASPKNAEEPDSTREKRKFQSIIRQIQLQEKAEPKQRGRKKLVRVSNSSDSSDSEGSDETEDKDSIIYDDENSGSEDEKKEGKTSKKTRSKNESNYTKKNGKNKKQDSKKDTKKIEKSENEQSDSDVKTEKKQTVRSRGRKKTVVESDNEKEEKKSIKDSSSAIDTKGFTLYKRKFKDNASPTMNGTDESLSNKESRSKKKRSLEIERAKMFKYLQNFIVDWPASKQTETGNIIHNETSGNIMTNIPGVNQEIISHLTPENVEVISLVSPKLVLKPNVSSNTNIPNQQRPLESILKKETDRSGLLSSSSEGIPNVYPSEVEGDAASTTTNKSSLYDIRIPKKTETTHKLSIEEYAKRKASLDTQTSTPSILSPSSAKSDSIFNVRGQYPNSQTTFSSDMNQQQGLYQSGSSIFQSSGYKSPTPSNMQSTSDSSSFKTSQGLQFSLFPSPKGSDNLQSTIRKGGLLSTFPITSNFNPQAETKYNSNSSDVLQRLASSKSKSHLIRKPPDLPLPPNLSPSDVLMNWCKQFLRPDQMPKFDQYQSSEGGFTVSIILPHLEGTVINSKLPSPTIAGAENQASVRAMEHLWQLYNRNRGD
jgi:hypothetical protein